jgi:hypothetical protein
MKSLLSVLSTLFVTISCSSGGSAVGTGAGFDTFTTQPTALELGSPFFLAAVMNRTPARLSIPEALRSRAETLPTLAPTSKGGTYNCPGGGTIVWSRTSDSSSVHYQATLTDCSVTATVQTKSYTEKFTGTVSEDGTAGTNLAVAIKLALSASGDLGFAVDCNLGLIIAKPSDSATGSGSCTLRDAAGHKIEGTGEDLKSLVL